MKLSFIGAGVMGESMISAILQNNVVSHNDIWACDIDPSRLTYIEEKYKVNCTLELQNATGKGDIIILSVKPQIMGHVLHSLKSKVKKEQLILSIAAGIKTDVIRSILGHDRIVRVMPNTPAQVGQGMSVWTRFAMSLERHSLLHSTSLMFFGLPSSVRHMWWPMRCTRKTTMDLLGRDCVS